MLSCGRCDGEILPGQNVDFITDQEGELGVDIRIMTEGQFLVIHADEDDCGLLTS